ncbi:hypothetical protein HZH68_016693 [Vespula germanica]|uniref:Uncharacterized protein n=1 Tax=Vespula germanica TaxID=30212 RepID=A0A834MP22_VESGE|nr:hypothetical protein HZH68_016693 [Vespula germanica]
MYTSNRKGNAVSGRWVGLAWLGLAWLYLGWVDLSSLGLGWVGLGCLVYKTSLGEEDFVGYIGKGGSIKLEGLIFERSASLLVLRYLYCVIDMLMIGSNLID